MYEHNIDYRKKLKRLYTLKLQTRVEEDMSLLFKLFMLNQLMVLDMLLWNVLRRKWGSQIPMPPKRAYDGYSEKEEADNAGKRPRTGPHAPAQEDYTSSIGSLSDGEYLAMRKTFGSSYETCGLISLCHTSSPPCPVPILLIASSFVRSTLHL